MTKELAKKIAALNNLVISKKNIIPYINLDDKNKYKGWTQDFKIFFPEGNKMTLNLKEKSDLFLLFVLASSWSRTGQWENAAYFVTYLKYEKKGFANYWMNNNNINIEIQKRKYNAKKIVESCKGIVARKKVSFRKDSYSSIKILATNWDKILNSLDNSNKKNDFFIFINFISSINGLGSNNNKMKIKIPLILRELKCQNIYENIPGEYCCVPDKRVIDASKELGIKIPHVHNLPSLFKASKAIYDVFGELYDIPLFSYQDLKEDSTIL